MAVSLALIGVFYLATGLGLLTLLIKPFNNPDKPSTGGFVLVLTAAATNSTAEGLNLLISDHLFSLAVWYVRVFGSAVSTAGWLLLAIGFTTGRTPRDRYRMPLYGYLGILGTALVIDATMLSESIFAGEMGRGWAEMTVWVHPDWAFWTNAMINYGFLFTGTGLLLVEIARSSGLRRRQATILASASLPPGVLNILVIAGITTFVYDITIFGFAAAVVLFTVAIYRMSVLDLAPVARQTAMEEMDDAVLTLDGDDRVVDCNGAARELFELDESEYFGQAVTDCCPPAITDALDRFAQVDDVDTQVALDHDGLKRSFSLSISPIRATEQSDGRVVVLRDITPLKQREEDLESREEELDLLRQVFSRVLRHNLRNELTVIHGSAQDLAEQMEQPLSGQAELISEASEDLLDIGQKARYIERIIDSEDGLVERDLLTVATNAAKAVRQRSPDATIEIVDSDPCTVWASPELEAAVENLIENAVEHNTASPTVRVEISHENDTPQLSVTDNGPGIADEELVVLDAESETQLSHGSGIGLWLVKWVVDNSNANLTFETDDSGTDVTIQFEQSAVPPAVEG